MTKRFPLTAQGHYKMKHKAAGHKSARATGKGCWYKHYHWECILCFHSYSWKKRRYNPKPKDSHKRHVLIQEVCHFH